jgi:hypothetical protein
MTATSKGPAASGDQSGPMASPAIGPTVVCADYAGYVMVAGREDFPDPDFF